MSKTGENQSTLKEDDLNCLSVRFDYFPMCEEEDLQWTQEIYQPA